jgi:hypothetical protein
MTNSQKHSSAVVCVVCIAIALTILASVSALAASSVYVHDEGHLHYTGSSGSLLNEEGAATGTIPGKLQVHFDYTGTSLTVTAQFTITGRDWSLTGHGTGTLSNPNSPSPSFRGPLTITSGDGRYAHAHAHGELFGVFYRRKHYALTVQTLGELHF